jgi:uncharacterized protein (TIGR00369 family)
MFQYYARSMGAESDALSAGIASMAALEAGDLEQATALIRQQVRLHDRMGVNLVAVTDDSAVLTMELSEETAGSVPGTVHGGLLAAFADLACAMAIWRSVDITRQIQVTTDLHTRYFRQPRRGPLEAQAMRVHDGRHILSAECIVRDADQRVLSRSTATYMVIDRVP